MWQWEGRHSDRGEEVFAKMLSEQTRAALWGCATAISAQFAMLCLIALLRKDWLRSRHHIPPEVTQSLPEMFITGFLLSLLVLIISAYRLIRILKGRN